MKMKLSILFFAGVMFISSAYSQIKFGVKAALTSSTIKASDFVTSGNDMKVQTLTDGKYGFQGGVMLQVKLVGVFIQPEVLLATAGGQIQLTDISTNTTKVVDQRFTNLTIPVLVGYKIGPLRAGLGPVANIVLSKPSDALNFSNSNVESKFNSATFGYQVGVGLDIWKLALDLRYEGSLSKLGNGMTIDGKSYNFDSRISQWVFGVGYWF